LQGTGRILDPPSLLCKFLRITTPEDMAGLRNEASRAPEAGVANIQVDDKTSALVKVSIKITNVACSWSYLSKSHGLIDALVCINSTSHGHMLAIRGEEASLERSELRVLRG
jgi:hypothetical protein